MGRILDRWSFIIQRIRPRVKGCIVDKNFFQQLMPVYIECRESTFLDAGWDDKSLTVTCRRGHGPNPASSFPKRVDLLEYHLPIHLHQPDRLSRQKERVLIDKLHIVLLVARSDGYPVRVDASNLDMGFTASVPNEQCWIMTILSSAIATSPCICIFPRVGYPQGIRFEPKPRICPVGRGICPGRHKNQYVFPTRGTMYVPTTWWR